MEEQEASRTTQNQAESTVNSPEEEIYLNHDSEGMSADDSVLIEERGNEDESCRNSP